MKNSLKTAITGIITGFANGLFGSGGGTIAVPCMEKYLGVDAHKSHATAIAVILPLSVLSAAIYIFRADVPWSETLAVSVGGVAGGITGAKLLNRISSRKLHIIFGLAMLAAAARMFI